ncbi:ABC-F family ATP-binding cassette domain-containing protein [soil metagenome]
MVNVVSLEAVSKRHAEKLVLDGVTLGIADGDRIGVIGANGSGKSTLLRVVAGDLEADAGRVAVRNSVRIHHLPQDPVFPAGATPVGALLAADTPPARAAMQFEQASAAVRAEPGDAQAQAHLEARTARMDATGGWDVEQRARALLDKLGVRDVEGQLATRSGGERKRVALAAALLEPAELLILDEPTNHLDIDIVEWLQDQLTSWPRALLLVTHDRYLLDSAATRIVEIHDGGLRSHPGGYASYLETRALREEQAAASERKRASYAREELAWLRRGPKARTSKAKYRVERARAVLDAAPRAERAQLSIDLPSRRLGGKVVNLHQAGVAFGDRQVLVGLDHKLAPDARIGVVGPNGSGKSTLLRLIAGELEPTQGSVRHGETVKVGFFRQDFPREDSFRDDVSREGRAAGPRSLAPRTRVFDAVHGVLRETELTSGARVTASELLERFLFDGAAQKAYTEELSGGERRRLELLLVLADAPNLLLLDEPTNDLDLDTLAVLEAYLDEWPGALVVASHDRYFLDRVCDDLFGIEPGGAVRHYPGGLSSALVGNGRAYRARQGEERRRLRAAPMAIADSPDTARTRRTGRAKRSYAEQRELNQLERRIATLEERRQSLSGELAAAGDDYVVLAELGTEATGVEAELTAAETRWLELATIGEDT